MRNILTPFAAILLIASIVVISAGALYYTSGTSMEVEITTFEECVEAGNPILESYPEQCKTEDGRTFVKQYPTELSSEIGEVEYYGSYTDAYCEVDSDCVANGCNSEICTNKDDLDRLSICMFPDKPLPSELGYNCSCVQNGCKWQK